MAAITATTVWEVRSTAGTDRGGGFDASVAVPGTDYSQQPGIQKTYTDLVIDASDSTKATSVLIGFTAADVGNVYNVTSGTGFTVQRITLIAVTGGTPATAVGTFNASLGTVASVGGNAKMGGAVSTLTTPAKVAGNKVWMKATGTYSITAANNIFTVSGTAGAYIEHEGYTSTRPSGTSAQSGGSLGDGGQITVQRSSGATFSMIGGTGAYNIGRNIFCDAVAGGTAIGGFNLTGVSCVLYNCKAINWTTAGFICGASKFTLINCSAASGSGTAGFSITTATGVQLVGCIASDNTTHGFLVNHNSALTCIFVRCIADTNTGAGITGFKVNNTATGAFWQCLAYGNTSDGILFDTTTVATAAEGGSVRGCILEANGGYGINANASNVPSFNADYNAYYNNNSGGTQRNNLPTGAHDVALSGSAFTNAAGQDFTLNNTAGAGAACRAVSWPGALQVGGTGYLDIGPLQHQDSGGGMIMSRVRTGF